LEIIKTIENEDAILPVNEVFINIDEDDNACEIR